MLKLLIIGNLGKDSVVNNANGHCVINFSVAHTEKYRNKDGEQVQKTTWCECAWWTDKTAIVPYLKKGSQVYVEGQPEIKTYTKNDGSTGTSLGVRVGMVQLLGGGSNSNEQASPKATAQAQNNKFNQQAPDSVQEVIGDNDDLPF